MARRSERVHRVLTLHIELSRTRRGSLSSTKTILSLPMAVPLGHAADAEEGMWLVLMTQLDSTSLSMRSCTTSENSSAYFQLLSHWMRARLVEVPNWRPLMAGRGRRERSQERTVRHREVLQHGLDEVEAEGLAWRGRQRVRRRDA